MSRLSNLPAIVLLVAVASPFATGVVSAAPDTVGNCFQDWSDAAPIVAREQLLAARDVQELTRRQLFGDVVRITLCREGTGYVYRLLHRDNNGRISNHKIDAHGGQRPSDEQTRAHNSQDR